MEKYSKKRLAIGLICLLSGLIIFLYGILVVATSPCPSCQAMAFPIILISMFPILIGMIISIKEFEKYSRGV